MDDQAEPQLPVRRAQQPESRTASAPRSYTPQSSSSTPSNAHLLRGSKSNSDREPSRNADRSQSGSLLQEKLKEKKAAMQSERGSGTDIDRAVQSSPVRYGATSRQASEKEQRRPDSGGRGSGKKGMGIKDMEEANNTLHKQNFDLKLELFHRRQRQTALEEQLEAAEARSAEQEETQMLNEQLLAELQKRDQAVEEAVAMICRLEEDVERLLKERSIVKSFDVEYEPSYSGSNHRDTSDVADISSSPPQLTPRAKTPAHMLKAPQRTVARMPSFLSEHSENTEALRSLYVPRDDDGTALSSPRLLAKSEQGEDEEPEVMSSPRLSLLSESSFLSVYGEKMLAVEALDLDEGSAASQARRTSSSIHEWIADGDNIIRNRRQSSLSRSQNGISKRNLQTLSLNAVLESPLQRLEKLERHVNAATPTRHRPRSIRKIKPFDPRHTHSSQALPPTPDTVSTSTLRLYKDSSHSLAQDYEESDNRRTPRPSPSTINEELLRPRSAGETITSRREGPGWDTATPSDISLPLGDDNSEGGESFDPWLATADESDGSPPIPPHRNLAQGLWKQKQERLIAPDMFSFSAMHDEPVFTDDTCIFEGERQQSGRARAVMFNEDTTIDLPAMSRHLQRIGIGEEVRLDDAAVPNRPPSTLPLPRGSPLVIRTKPGRSRRNSALVTGDARSHTPRTVGDTADSSPAPVVATTAYQTARSRLTSKIFRRSGSYSAPIPSQTPPPPATTSHRASGAQPTKDGSSPVKRLQTLPRSQTYNDLPPPRPSRPLNPLRPGSRDGPRPMHAHAQKLSVDLASLHTIASATPPPISRYPRTGSGLSNLRGAPAVRPGSAGCARPKSAGVSTVPPAGGSRFGSSRLPLVGRARRLSQGQTELPLDLGGVDGVGGDERAITAARGADIQRPKTVGNLEGNKPPSISGGMGVKKWLGLGVLGRTGSVKK